MTSSFVSKFGLYSPPTGPNDPSLYSPLAEDVADSTSSFELKTTSETSSDDANTDHDGGARQLQPAQRRSAATAGTIKLPTLSRFLADFTLGFADGLTVPFALTAGLSSLGQTETVIYAGLAEICAGSISMGIGGYLSARGEAAAYSAAAASGPEDESGQDEEAHSGKDEEKLALVANEDLVDSYLAPLSLPEELREAVIAHTLKKPSIRTAIKEMRRETPDDEQEGRACSSILVGCSVSLGYLLGGLLPLFPYFFVTQVGDGLLWSFITCIIALFVFGFSKQYALTGGDASEADKAWKASPARRRALRWRRIRQSIWEGVQMVIMGGVAAIFAVLCVRALERAHPSSQQGQ